jgi:tRNA(Ile)-lysidine synthase
VLVMLSGGRDSVCLLHMIGTSAMHMNYGLRAEADGDEAFCRSLCESLEVPLTVVRPASVPRGNLQAWAREERYRAAEKLTEGDIGVGHTASDQVETVLYRLLASPGRRGLLGMKPRSGRIVRPLLGMSRAETTAYCVAHGLAWRDDASNSEVRFARNRIRELLAVHPAAEANVLRTLELLGEEAEVLASVVSPEPSVVALRAMPAALLRLTLQRMADDAGGRVAIRDAERVLRGADLGGGLRSVVEQGNLRFEMGRQTGNTPTTLTIPGQIEWGNGVLTADLAGLTSSGLDPASLNDVVQVRQWQHGDRMRPAGLNGTKSLQDIFTDRKVPREQRHRVPVVTVNEEIAWVPGVTSDRFKAAEGPSVRLAWTEN